MAQSILRRTTSRYGRPETPQLGRQRPYPQIPFVHLLIELRILSLCLAEYLKHGLAHTDGGQAT